MIRIHIGRKVPKALADKGWKEDGSMHIGHGCWLIRLKASPQIPKRNADIVATEGKKEK